MTQAQTKQTGGYLAWLSSYGIYLVLALLVLVFSMGNSRFLTVENLLLILQQASPLGIAVVGMIFVLLVGGIDISVGASMFFASTLAGVLLNACLPPAWIADGWALAIVMPLVLVLGALIGWINGMLATRFQILPFIVTLATASILKGTGLKISGSASIGVSALGDLANGRLGPIPNVLILFVLILLVGDFVLRRTVYGRHLMAIGDSPRNAERAGIPVNRNMVSAYMICGMLGTLAGILSAGQIGSVSAGFGDGNEFIIISAAVLGGTSLFGGKGSILPGAVIGILLVTTIMNGLAMMNASPFIYTIVRGLVIFIAIAIDSRNYKGELR